VELAQTASAPVIVQVGSGLTVKVAAVVGTSLPQLLLKRARYCLELSAATVAKLNVVLVAPAISFQVPPPSVLTCHCTVGVGLPDAAAVKEAELPTHTAWLAGLVVTDGGVLMVWFGLKVPLLLLKLMSPL
jgi:hypothetical protein